MLNVLIIEYLFEYVLWGLSGKESVCRRSWKETF